MSWRFGYSEKTGWLERYGWFQNSWRHSLVDKHLQNTYCPISYEVKQPEKETLSTNRMHQKIRKGY